MFFSLFHAVLPQTSTGQMIQSQGTYRTLNRVRCTHKRPYHKIELCAKRQIECANVGKFLDNNNSIYWAFNNIPSTVLSTLHVLTDLIPRTPSWCRNYYNPHFIGKKINLTTQTVASTLELLSLKKSTRRVGWRELQWETKLNNKQENPPTLFL